MKLSKEIRIALVAILGIVIMYFGMNFLKGISLLSDDEVYYITFKDVNGLSASSPIFANGYQVGVVRGIDYDFANNSEIVVTFTVDDDLRIPKGSTAEIISDMMGKVKMNLLIAEDISQGVVNPGDTIVGSTDAGIVGKVAGIVPEVEKMLPKLDSILISVNALLSDPNITKSMSNVQQITKDLTTSTRELNTLMANLNKNVPGLMDRANGVLDNTTRLTDNLASVDIDATMSKVNQTLTNVQTLTEKLNNKQGTLGLLMNDPSLYNKLTKTVQSADTLLNNLRAHPKRYVHFSIFGKKEKPEQ
ncbi:MAG: MCE family protein [Prevotella sp.]|nr:MCE family protein [Prevotella sp.]MBQ1645826.1 MCE family protein [Prevotella sp.]MBQ2523108.1 MCE family protein [Prevotella sp.]MBQ5577828.1 MCE family protein [Prevotella sp.]MBR6936589.1 MCE family protein [Prevotella sp.]